MGRNLFGCFMLGVGVGAGMVVAAQMGKQSRQRLRGSAGEGSNYLKQRGAALSDSAANLVGKGKKATERRLDEESLQRMEGEGGCEQAVLR